MEETELNDETTKSKSCSNGNEEEGTSAQENDDGEIDNVTPKLRRRNTASAHGVDNGQLVTPLDSEDSPADLANASGPVLEGESDDNCNDKTGGNGVSSISVENTLQPNETTIMQENNAIPQQEEVAPTQYREESRREWDQMQLPERAREGDRRGWEQMQLNFQRIEKKQLQRDMNRMLSSDEDGEDRG